MSECTDLECVKFCAVYIFSLSIAVLLIYTAVFIDKPENIEYKSDVMYGVLVLFCLLSTAQSLYLIFCDISGKSFFNVKFNILLLLCVSIFLVVFSTDSIKDSNDYNYEKEITQISIITMILGSVILIYTTSSLAISLSIN